jgi:PPOX class probable F420-dependent enzyme
MKARRTSPKIDDWTTFCPLASELKRKARRIMTVFAITGALGKCKYVSLTTFRRSGEPVSTPVWIAPDETRADVLYVFTGASTGKAKRIRKNASVELTACDFRGNVRGDAIPATARILAPEEAKIADRALTRKYPIVKRAIDFINRRSRGTRVFLAITPDSQLTIQGGEPADEVSVKGRKGLDEPPYFGAGMSPRSEARL